MKTILKYLRDFLQENFNVKVYVFTILFLSVLVYFNYRFDF